MVCFPQHMLIQLTDLSCHSSVHRIYTACPQPFLRLRNPEINRDFCQPFRLLFSCHCKFREHFSGAQHIFSHRSVGKPHGLPQYLFERFAVTVCPVSVARLPCLKGCLKEQCVFLQAAFQKINAFPMMRQYIFSFLIDPVI